MDDGATPLALAAALGLIDLCVLFLRAGADVNARMADGRTPLMLAAASGCTCLFWMCRGNELLSPGLVWSGCGLGLVCGSVSARHEVGVPSDSLSPPIHSL
eukprot:NODE_14846_length_335_cov_1.853147_g13682_i0.p2 GENE.NODE_14846_length_335_cov_1.853147_g13682_i0~~NODE_14846_length_335_cov_1.853147_g13682_i0.p2  ORF type:complete len:108 (+),score=14.74 NODE_14846_length_335_cov_1.853147_g13682_i0:22-324(+)